MRTAGAFPYGRHMADQRIDFKRQRQGRGRNAFGEDFRPFGKGGRAPVRARVQNLGQPSMREAIIAMAF